MREGAHLFQIPGRVIAGPGSIEDLPGEVSRLGRKVLVVTGRRSLEESGRLGKIMEGLGTAGVSAVHFSGREGEPDVTDVDRAREAIRREGIEVVAAVGGGERD